MLSVYNYENMTTCEIHDQLILIDTSVVNLIISGNSLVESALELLTKESNTFCVAQRTFDEMSIQSDKGYSKDFNQKPLTESAKESIEDLKEKEKKLFSLPNIYPSYLDYDHVENKETLEKLRVETGLPHTDATIFLTAKLNGIDCIWSTDRDFGGMQEGILLTNTFTYNKLKNYGINAYFKK